MKSSIPACPLSTVGPGKTKYFETAASYSENPNNSLHDTVGTMMFLLNKCVAPRYSDSNGNSRGPSPSPTPSVSVSSQRAPRPVSLTVPSLLGKDSSSLCHGSAGSLVEAVSVHAYVRARVYRIEKLLSTQKHTVLSPFHIFSVNIKLFLSHSIPPFLSNSTPSFSITLFPISPSRC